MASEDQVPRRQKETPTQRAQRSVVFMALVGCAFGFFGAIASIGGAMSSTVTPPALVTEESTSVEELKETLGRITNDALYRAPLRRPLLGANALVTILLVVAGVMLFRWKQSAIWWTTQACLANIFWAIADGASQVWALWGAVGELTPLAEAFTAVHTNLPAELHPSQLLAGRMFAVSLGVLAQLLLYGWMLWRVRRADVRKVLAS